MRKIIWLWIVCHGGLAGAVFTQEAWKKTAGIYQAILKHPFITELASGQLPSEKFSYYLQQDSAYLGCFARALKSVAHQSEGADRKFFKKEAEASVQAEQAMQKELLERLGKALGTEMAPSNTAYCNHLLASTAQGSPGVRVVALLPCYWIYLEVGKHLKKVSVTPNPYQRWIALYSSSSYEQAVNHVLGIVDKLAEQAGEKEREEMFQTFEKSVRYEWYFWDAAYQLEKWKP